MKGMISLKDFIQGVKKELQEASAEGAKNPFLELTQVELEAEFGIDAKASAEGGLKFLVKIGGETSASQLHRVKLVFSPLSPNNILLALPSSDPTDPADPNKETPSNEPSGRPIGPVFHVIPQPFTDPTGRHQRILGPIFSPPDAGLDDKRKIEQVVEETLRKLDLTDKGGKGPGGSIT